MKAMASCCSFVACCGVGAYFSPPKSRQVPVVIWLIALRLAGRCPLGDVVDVAAARLEVLKRLQERRRPGGSASRSSPSACAGQLEVMRVAGDRAQADARREALQLGLPGRVGRLQVESEAALVRRTPRRGRHRDMASGRVRERRPGPIGFGIGGQLDLVLVSAIAGQKIGLDSARRRVRLDLLQARRELSGPCR